MCSTFNGYNIKSIMEKYGYSSRPVQCSIIWSIIYMTGNPDLEDPFRQQPKTYLKEIKAALAKDARDQRPSGTDTGGSVLLQMETRARPSHGRQMQLCDHDPSGKRGLPCKMVSAGKTGTGNVSVKERWKIPSGSNHPSVEAWKENMRSHPTIRLISMPCS